MNEIKKDPMIAAILSFLCCGLGQIYAGRVTRGIIIYFLAFIGIICFILPGLFIWLWNIFDASDQAKEYNKVIEEKIKSRD